MEINQNNLAEEVLEHHGILGMHWGIRRYQPYPSGYSGDGKFMGKRAARKAAKAEIKKARHQAKVQTKIRNAVDNGDKKSLKKLKDEMTPQEYEDRYEQAVKNGIENAVKDRSTLELRKYKEDMTPRQYEHEKTRIEFKEAVDEDKNRKIKRLMTQVDQVDLKEATELIKSRIALEDQKLNKIKQDTELMARMDKINNSLNKMSTLAKNVSNISSSISDVSEKMSKLETAQKEKEDAKKKKEIEKIVRSGNLDKIKANAHEMDANQLREAYDRIVMSGNKEDLIKAAPYMNSTQVTQAVNKLSKLSELTGEKPNADTKVNKVKTMPEVQVVENWLGGNNTMTYLNPEATTDNLRTLREAGTTYHFWK